MSINWKAFYANGGWNGQEPPDFYEDGIEDEEQQVIICPSCYGTGYLTDNEEEVGCCECNTTGYIKI